MTSEGPHRPGQEPDEVSPGAGGPAPYGDRPAQPDNGYNAAGPDLGWAPPPPARPNPSAPAWATQSEQQPNPAWGAAAAPQSSDPAQPAWATGGAAPEQGQPAAWTPPQQGWTPPEQAAPAWSGGSAEQPDWAQAQPAARGAAQVPPATAAWPAAQDDPSRSGGWAGAGQANPPAGEWHAEPAQPAGRSGAPGPQDDPAGSGGWAVGAAAARDDQPVWTPAEQAPQAWGQSAEPAEQPSPGWGQAESAGSRGAAQVPAANWPAQEEAPQPAAWGGAEGRPQQPDWVLAPQDQPTERPEPTAWPQAEQAGPAAARASVSVPSSDATPGWAAAGPDNPVPANPGVAEVQPWAPGEVWGRAEAEAQSRGGWDADRADEPPVYQPAPAPGISPANAVPLPPQEQRVPGASLAAAPPADYAPSTQYPPIPEQPAYSERDTPEAAAQYEAEPAGWGRAEEASASAAAVPAPRTSPESGAGRAVVPVSDAESAASAAGRASASASVPLASRVMPPADQAMRPTSAATPQPRVYGRPAQPEPDNEPEQAAPEALQADPAPERSGMPDWQQDAGRQGTPDWQQAPERPAAPDWQQDAGRPATPDWQQAPERPGPPDWQNGPDRQGFPGWGDDSPSEPQFDDRERSSAPNGFGEPPLAAAAPPAFPPGVPSFVDAPGNNRPVNGVRPQSGGERPADRFGAPAAGAAAVNGAPGFGGPAIEQAPGGQFAAFPPPQQPPSWGQEATESDQGRFDSFKPEADEPKAEPPVPKVRNGRVLAAVLIAAVLILAVPLGLLMLLGKFGGGDDSSAFDPAVGTCVKQAGQGASAVDCGEAGAFTIVSKVDAKDKCADPAQPHVVLPGEGTNRVLCLKPATK
ncbi:hypothetical protein [Micromonospora sp. NBC_00617]|uniref:LppU/SCO3897 family protein n=1 Tax=Micromonospora sp. NBC_00617 TaxID=2903587 RepID=UPI0030E3E085